MVTDLGLKVEIPGLSGRAVRLWNTLYMDQALQHLKTAGVAVLPADVARLSPLEHRTINLLGRYTFTLPEAIARGEMRPLRQTEEPGLNLVSAATSGA